MESRRRSTGCSCGFRETRSTVHLSSSHNRRISHLFFPSPLHVTLILDLFLHPLIHNTQQVTGNNNKINNKKINNIEKKSSYVWYL